MCKLYCKYFPSLPGHYSVCISLMPGLLSVPSCHSRWHSLRDLENYEIVLKPHGTAWYHLCSLGFSEKAESYVQWSVSRGMSAEREKGVLEKAGEERRRGGKERRGGGAWDKSLDCSTVLRKSQSNHFTHWGVLSLLYVISIPCVYALLCAVISIPGKHSIGPRLHGHHRGSQDY